MKEKFKDKGFVVKFAACIIAAAVLIFALVYYNFILPSPEKKDDMVGKDCPIITLDCVTSKNANTQFSVEECRGKVTVINFWFTTCGPCIAELPYFIKVNEEYDGQINMVAIHSYDERASVIQEFIDKTTWDGERTWSDSTVMFARDTKQIYAFGALGGKNDSYPRTLILNADGVVTYAKNGSVSESTLRSEIVKAMNK